MHLLIFYVKLITLETLTSCKEETQSVASQANQMENVTEGKV